MTPADLRALADQRYEAAVREGLEQMAKGWKPAEVVAVLADAAEVVSVLRVRANAADEVQALKVRHASVLRTFTALIGGGS